MARKGPVIRCASNADVPAARALVYRILAEFGLKPDVSGMDADLDDIESAYAGGVFDLIFDERGELAGTAGMVLVDPVRVEIRKMYFAPHIRGRGWGALELERLLALARSRGFERAQLETASVLRGAIAMYHRFGFVDAPAERCAPRCDRFMTLDL